ncbi:MAG: response regulator, partial [Spirochaetales bacterium]|nr:response regulator [Spirochaetales bacterium]
ALGLMAGGVAHDLNNILSGIVGYPDLIMMSIDKDHEIVPYVDAIKKSGLRAADVVADLLTIARGAASTKKLCLLNIIIDQYLESPEYKTLESKMENINLIRKYDPGLLNFSCSEIHIKKCIMNLIMNSIEAMPDGGDLLITTKNCYVDTPFTIGQYMEKGEYVVMSVKDSGHGITEEDKARIFEPFYTKKVMGLSGTGLGLSVVWSTVQDHNGGIVLKSSDKGTLFELYFPADRSNEVIELESSEMSNYMGKGETVLIIDDEPLQQEIASGMVNCLGYRSASVGSGKEALGWLESNKADILILDMIMPSGMSGFHTYKEIIRNYSEQKAIIASGYAQTMDVENTIKLGAGRFIRKPYTIEVLGKALYHELRKK